MWHENKENMSRTRHKYLVDHKKTYEDKTIIELYYLPDIFHIIFGNTSYWLIY